MIFANAFKHQIGRLYNKLMPAPCFLCGAATKKLPLCQDCMNDLPLLEHACKRCALPITQGAICGSCLKNPPVQTQCFSLLRYENTAKRCLTAYKFEHKTELVHLFSNMMSAQLHQRQGLPEYLLPIPLHPDRLRQRGFNQSALLALQLAQQLRTGYLAHTLHRIRDTPPQHELPLKKRKSNLKHAFVWQGTAVPRHVALIDDVMTTGATVQEAARVLHQIGIANIEVWTIARAC